MTGFFAGMGFEVSASPLQESPAVASLLSGEVQVIQGGGAGTLASAARGSDLTVLANVSMGVTSQRAAALESGALDGSLLDLIVGKNLVDSGKFHVLYDLAAQKVQYPSSTVARKSWLTANHDPMQRYIDDLIEGISRTKQDEALAIATYKKYSKTDDAVAQAAYSYFKPLLLSQPLPKAEEFSETAQVLAGVNPKVASLDLNALIDASFVKNAVDRGLGK